MQWSLYFKTTHVTKKMWSYIAGGLKIKVIKHKKLPFGTKSSGLIIKGGRKIEGCKTEGLQYLFIGTRTVKVEKPPRLRGWRWGQGDNYTVGTKKIPQMAKPF